MRQTILARGGGKRKRSTLTAAEEDAEDAPVDLEKTVRQMDNCVYFHTAVSRESILLLVEKIRAAETAALAMFRRATDAYILLFIHSEGGDAYAGLSGLNHIQQSRVRVITVSDGFVASAATFLLLGGVRRYAMTHSCVLIHQVSGMFWGKYAEMQDDLKNSTQLMDMLRRLYREKTIIKPKRLEKMLQGELTLSATQCLKYGIVDGMYDAAKFAPLVL